MNSQKIAPLYVFEDKRCYQRIPEVYENKANCVDILSRRTYFRDKNVACGAEYRQNVAQLNPNADKCYLFFPP